MAREWNIRPQSVKCAICEKDFTHGESMVSALFNLPEGEGYERKDFCPDCFEKEKGSPFCSWRSVFSRAESQARQNDPIAHETAEDLLRRLVDIADPENTAIIYILAVMLERKRKLVERSAVPVENGIMRFYEHRPSGDTFQILDPRLGTDDIPAIQEKIMQMLAK